MISVDTNVVARFILGDDEQQATAAANVLQQPFFLSFSVLVELGWVLEKSIGMARRQMADAIGMILSMEQAIVPNADGLEWAIERYRTGADWADMVHLVAAASRSDRFYSFDRKLSQQAGADAPLLVETL